MDAIDTDAAARFLAALTGDARHSFQTFPDRKGTVRGLTRILHGTFERHAATLAALNAEGAGVFVMVNRGDGMGRKAANVTGARALFVDLDGSPLTPVLAAPIPPRIVVESSPERWHTYWPIVDLPPERFSAAQKQLAALFAGDPKVHDKPRVMRLPGFVHRKSSPFVSRLVKCEDAPLTWAEMAEAFGLSARMTLPDRIPEGERNDQLFKLARSAAAKGVPEARELDKLRKVNADRCRPPLSDGELRQLVASAYKARDTGAVLVPMALLDSEAFKALDNAARTMLVLAYRRADNFGPFPLPYSELQEWFPRKKTFHAIRRRLVRSGLLRLVIEPVKKQPRNGIDGRSGFYQLSIGPFSATYPPARTGPFSATPEALQALGSVALEDEGGDQSEGQKAA